MFLEVVQIAISQQFGSIQLCFCLTNLMIVAVFLLPMGKQVTLLVFLTLKLCSLCAVDQLITH